jgi:hypothetical protein
VSDIIAQQRDCGPMFCRPLRASQDARFAGLDNKRIEAEPSGEDALHVRHRCPRAIARHENGRGPNQPFVISSNFLLEELCLRLRTNGSLNSTAGESYRRQGRFRLQNGADIIGKFANAPEAPAAALYDAESQPRPPPCSKRRSVNGYYQRCRRFSHWQTTVPSLPMICRGRILRLRTVLFEP